MKTEIPIYMESTQLYFRRRKNTFPQEFEGKPNLVAAQFYIVF
jgi:hypothetical protein